MFGIDIYNGQRGIQLSKLRDVKFVIVKATEGQGLVDKSCDSFVEQAKALGLPWGFYHYAKNNSGKFDADYFYRNTKNYFGHGLPVLDYEDPRLLTSGKGVAYCEQFAEYIHSKSGVWPVMYMSASVCKTFKASWIPSKCPLWVAGYPRTYKQFVDVPMPYSVDPWPSAIIWQFSGSGRLDGFNGTLDLDRAYITNAQWQDLAAGRTIDKNDNITTACKVILGYYGNGAERKQKLAAEGYNYSVVQGLVNEILALER